MDELKLLKNSAADFSSSAKGLTLSAIIEHWCCHYWNKIDPKTLNKQKKYLYSSMKSCTNQISENLSAPVPSPQSFSDIVSYHKHCIDCAKIAQSDIKIKFFPTKSRNHGVTYFSSACKHTSKARKENGNADHDDPFSLCSNETSNDAKNVAASFLGMIINNTTQNRK